MNYVHIDCYNGFLLLYFIQLLGMLLCGNFATKIAPLSIFFVLFIHKNSKASGEIEIIIIIPWSKRGNKNKYSN